MKRYIYGLIFPLLVFTNSYSMEECKKIKEELKKESKESKKRKLIKLEDSKEQALCAKNTKKYKPEHELKYKERKAKLKYLTGKLKYVKVLKRKLEQTTTEKEEADSEEQNKKQKCDKKITDLIDEINQLLELVQDENSKTAEDIKNSLKEKLITAKAFWIVNQTELPEELRYPILLLVFQEYISITLNHSLCNIEEMACEEIVGTLERIKNKVEEYISNFLIFLHDLDIDINKIKDEENKVSTLIEYKKRFLKDLSPYFQQAIINELKKIPSQKKPIFCNYLINKMIAQSERDNYRNPYRLKNYKYPWKFIIYPLIKTISANDCQTKRNIMRWMVEMNEYELIEEILSITDHFKTIQIYQECLSHHKTLLLHIAIENQSFETAKLFIRAKFDVSADKSPITSIVKTMNLLAANPNDEKLINTCHELIKLLFECGTRVEEGIENAKDFNGIPRRILKKGLGLYEIIAYNNAIKANPLLKKMEEEDPNNSIKKLIDDAIAKATIKS